ncbi:protein cbg21229, partial [Cystoisospora suis]
MATSSRSSQRAPSRELGLRSDQKDTSPLPPVVRTSRSSIRYSSPSCSALPPPWELSRFRRRQAVGEERRRLRISGVAPHSFSLSRHLSTTSDVCTSRLAGGWSVSGTGASLMVPEGAPARSVALASQKPEFSQPARKGEYPHPLGTDTGSPSRIGSFFVSRSSPGSNKEGTRSPDSPHFATEDAVKRHGLTTNRAFVYALAAVHERGKYGGRDCLICPQTWQRLGNCTNCFAVLRCRKDSNRSAIVQLSSSCVLSPQQVVGSPVLASESGCFISISETVARAAGLPLHVRRHEVRLESLQGEGLLDYAVLSVGDQGLSRRDMAILQKWMVNTVVYQVPLEAGSVPPLSGFSSQCRALMLLMRRARAVTFLSGESRETSYEPGDSCDGYSSISELGGVVSRDRRSTTDQTGPRKKLELLPWRQAPPFVQTSDEGPGQTLKPRAPRGFVRREEPGGSEGGQLSRDDVTLKGLAAVTSGILGPSTMVAFRASGQEFVTLIQLSQEMWDFADDGLPHYDRLQVFLKQLFDVLRQNLQNHIMTVITFMRLRRYRRRHLKPQHQGPSRADFSSGSTQHEARAVRNGEEWELETEDRYDVLWEGPAQTLVQSQDAFLHTLSCYITHFSASIDCMPPGPITSAMKSDEDVSSESPALPTASTAARVPFKSSLSFSESEKVTGASARGHAASSPFPSGRAIRSDGGHLFTEAGRFMFARDTSRSDKEVWATAAGQSHLHEEQDSGGSLHRCGAASCGAARSCGKERRRRQRENEPARAEQKAEGQGDCRWWLSSAADGCLLEAVNLTTDMFATKHVDYACGLTSQHLLIVTAGSGVFHTSDLRLVYATVRSLGLSGVHPDLICLSQPPLHQVPVLLVHPLSAARTALNGIQVPSPREQGCAAVSLANSSRCGFLCSPRVSCCGNFLAAQATAPAGNVDPSVCRSKTRLLGSGCTVSPQS